jgi:MFS family permease
MGLAGLVPASLAAAVLLAASMGVFALGETLLSPVAPAMTNDLAPDHLRGRYNAVATAVFQGAGVVGPVVAGALLGRRLPAVFVTVLLAGCAVMVLLLRRVERVIAPRANGVPTDDVATVAGEGRHPVLDAGEGRHPVLDAGEQPEGVTSG